MKRILKFKHWQLFLLIVIAGAWTSPDMDKQIINFIAFLSFTIWIYAIGTYGQEKLATLDLPTQNLKLFNINILLIPILLIIFFTLASKQTADDSEMELTYQEIILIPVVLYLIFAIFQTVIFACKTISTIELKKEATFSDYFVNLILIVFLFVGVWILQPKITKLITNNEVPANG